MGSPQVSQLISVVIPKGFGSDSRGDSPEVGVLIH